MRKHFKNGLMSLTDDIVGPTGLTHKRSRCPKQLNISINNIKNNNKQSTTKTTKEIQIHHLTHSSYHLIPYWYHLTHLWHHTTLPDTIWHPPETSNHHMKPTWNLSDIISSLPNTIWHLPDSILQLPYTFLTPHDTNMTTKINQENQRSTTINHKNHDGLMIIWPVSFV